MICVDINYQSPVTLPKMSPSVIVYVLHKVVILM